MNTTDQNEFLLEKIKAKEIIEQRHFEYLVKIKDGIIPNNYRFTTTECGFDVCFQSGCSYCICEIKVRNDQPDSFFKQYGAFLEEGKYKRMCISHQQILQSANTNVNLYYLNFTRDSIEIYSLPLNHGYKYFDWLLPINNLTPNIKKKKSVTRIYNPIETIQLTGIIDEEEYLYINSAE